ncbi:hypothetical protein ABFY27_09550 [Akkermansia massiliensis]
MFSFTREGEAPASRHRRGSSSAPEGIRRGIIPQQGVPPAEDVNPAGFFSKATVIGSGNS